MKFVQKNGHALNNEIENVKWRNKRGKKPLAEPIGQLQLNLVQSIVGWRRFKCLSWNEGIYPFKGGNNNGNQIFNDNIY